MVLVRKGVKLLEEREGQGDVVQRQHEYILSIRLSLNKGQIIAPPPLHFLADPHPRQHDDGFFEHRTRVNRNDLIPGLFYAVQGMRIGGYRKVVISPHLAYADKGVPGLIPPHAPLVAEIRVLDRAEKPKRRPPEPGVTEAELLSQDELCRRYQISLAIFWHQRRAGRIPAPAVIDRPVRWRLSSVEQWEAAGRPTVNPSLNGARERRKQLGDRMQLVLSEMIDSLKRHEADALNDRRELLTELEGEIHTCDDQVNELALELALLVDEAGQWHGPPLDRLLDGDTTDHLWRWLAETLEAVLAT
jgi:predicted DNA-binding transcriptional regulator AlpA